MCRCCDFALCLRRSEDGTAPFSANTAAKAAGATSFKRPENGQFGPDGKFGTFFGPIAFGSEGYANSYTPPVLQIQGGKPVVLVPADIKMADFRLGV